MANQGWQPHGPPPGGGPFAAQWAAPQQAMPAFGPRPTVGQVYDLFVQLSQAEQGQFMTLVGGNTTNPTPPGYTRNPRTGQTFRMSAALQHTPGRTAVEEAVQRTARELKEFSRAHGVTVGNDGNAVMPTGGLNRADQADYDRLRDALQRAKAAKTAYMTAHPDEFRAPPQAGRGGAPQRGGRGGGPRRGRGNAP
jgi:hypothetical protein